MEIKAAQQLKGLMKQHFMELDEASRTKNKKIATDKAQWVNSITDIQTYDVMYNMAKLLIRRSHTASKKHNLFTLPYA